MVLSRTKNNIKRTIGRFFNIHRAVGKKDIFLFSSRRSGSTWLLEIINAERGVKYSDQPPDWDSNDRRLDTMNVNRYNIVCPNDEDKMKLKSYFQDLLKDKIQVNPPWNILDRNYDFFTNRYILKMTDTHTLIKWFEVNFDSQIVYLIRHPIAVALSIMKLGWGHTLDVFLNNDRFVNEWLRSSEFEFALEIIDGGDFFDQLILEWVLENLVPLRLIERSEARNWTVFSYEELVLEPELIIDVLGKKLDLENTDKMKESIRTPSKNAKGESREEIKGRDKRFLVTKWENRVSEEEKKRAFEILERFELSVYSKDRYFPREDLLIFSPDLE